MAGAVILPDARGWGVIFYTAIFPSILAQIFYVRGVELIGANRAGLFINLVPIFGTLLSVAYRSARRSAPTTPSPWRWCSAAYGWPRPADGRLAARSRLRCSFGLGEIAHQVARAIGPVRTVGRKPHAVDQRAELFDWRW